MSYFNKILTIVLIVPGLSLAKEKIQDSHSTIYTDKITRIVNALNIGEYQTEDDYHEMLQTACERNQCTPLEKQTIRSVGKQIVFCQIKHLKSHGIENADATALCQSKQAMLGCDTLITPLMRKMCYTGNRYNLMTWKKKEELLKNKSRMPASENK